MSCTKYINGTVYKCFIICNRTDCERSIETNVIGTCCTCSTNNVVNNDLIANF